MDNPNVSEKPERRPNVRPEWLVPGYSPSYLSPAFCGYDCGRSPAWAYALIKDRKLQAVRVEGALRVPRESWEQFKAALA